MANSKKPKMQEVKEAGTPGKNTNYWWARREARGRTPKKRRRGAPSTKKVRGNGRGRGNERREKRKRGDSRKRKRREEKEIVKVGDSKEEDRKSKNTASFASRARANGGRCKGEEERDSSLPSDSSGGGESSELTKTPFHQHHQLHQFHLQQSCQSPLQTAESLIFLFWDSYLRITIQKSIHESHNFLNDPIIKS